jgi:hypothetical protein
VLLQGKPFKKALQYFVVPKQALMVFPEFHRTATQSNMSRAHPKRTDRKRVLLFEIQKIVAQYWLICACKQASASDAACTVPDLQQHPS